MEHGTWQAGAAPADVIVVGGGLAGLAAAATLARAGRAVTLYEAAETLGGRARTQGHDGFLFNFGPHALYLGGPAEATLRELGVGWTGGRPSLAGYALDGGTRHRFPAGLRSLLATSLFGLGAKGEVATFLAGLPRLDAAPWQDVPVAAWLEHVSRRPEVRGFLAALIRVTSYAADTERHSAGAAIEQLRAGLIRGVRYLDGGWQTLADGLRAAAERAEARVDAGTRVAAIGRDPVGGRVREVRLDDGATLPVAGAVLLAASPAVAARLVERAEETPLPSWAAGATPVELACLDLGLRSLPDPRAVYNLGIDRPTYCSVHSAAARLAPGGGATVHVAKYLSGAGDARADERELEGVMDAVQPGWRELVVARRFLPRMTVANALVTAAGGGLAGRPGPLVPGAPGLYVAGDWVGAAGMLADASLGSAAEAARLILADRRVPASQDTALAELR